MCPRSGAGQVLTGTRTMPAFSLLPPAAGKGPCPLQTGCGDTVLQPQPSPGDITPCKASGRSIPAPFQVCLCRTAAPWWDEVGEGCWWHPQAPAHDTGTTHIYLGTGSLFKAFCSSLFTTSLPEARTHFWGGKAHFWGRKLHFCSAITQNAICIAHFGPPHTSPVSCLGQGPSGFFLHLPEIKPGLFHPKHEPCKLLFVSREPQPMSPGTGVVGGPVSRRAPGRAWLRAGTKASSSLETPIHHWQTRPAKVNI